MSVTEKKDVDEAIKRLLASGAKMPKEIRKAIVEKVGVSERVYYMHIKKLLEMGEIEEIFEEEKKGGRKVKKYRLRKKERIKSEAKGKGIVVPFPEPTIPRRLLELTAWIKFDPEGWPESDDVKEAKKLLGHYFTPRVEIPCEDPDKYAIVWPQLGDFISTRFFSLKSIYQAVEKYRIEQPTGDIFAAAFFSPQTVEYATFYSVGEWRPSRISEFSEPRVIEKPHSVAVAVCKDANRIVHVVYVEKCEEPIEVRHIDNVWAKGVFRQLGAKKFRAYDRLDEDFRRKIMLNLREHFEQRKLSIPKRYTKLIEELMDYSYNKPSNAYVPALAAAVDLCSKT